MKIWFVKKIPDLNFISTWASDNLDDSPWSAANNRASSSISPNGSSMMRWCRYLCEELFKFHQNFRRVFVVMLWFMYIFLNGINLCKFTKPLLRWAELAEFGRSQTLQLFSLHTKKILRMRSIKMFFDWLKQNVNTDGL